MKKLASLVLLVLLTSIPARSQLVLNAGDTFSYEFTSLPLIGQVFGQDAQVISGYVQFSILPESWQSGDSLKVELFNNGTVAEVFETAPTALSQKYSSPYIWQDFHGVFRLTQITGSSTIDNIVAGVVKGGPGSLPHYRYETAVTVPEPGVLTLGACGAVGLIAAGWKRSKRSAPRS